jgi:hypothetical protein
MSRSLSRRSFTAGSVAAIMGGSVLPLAPVRLMAQATDLSSLGLPTLDLTMSEAGYEGVPDEIEAGRYLVNLTIPDDMEEGNVGFMSPPPGMSAQDFIDMAGIVPGPPPEMDAEASPSAEGGEEMMEVPLFIYRATFAGGPTGAGGTTAQAVIDLPAGEWIAWADEPMSPQMPVVFNVTGEMPANLPEPQADITMTYIEFGIEIEGALTAGDHLMMIQNHGGQPHFVYVAQGPDSMTNEQIAETLEGEMNGMDPEELPINSETDLTGAFFTATQSIDTRIWVPVSLDAGTYAAFCFFPNAGEGIPHAYHGMHTVFTVE